LTFKNQRRGEMKMNSMSKVVAIISTAGIFAIGACSSDDAENSWDKAEMSQSGGKYDADLEAKICKEHGQPSDCDVCQVANWYNDGACDSFCRNYDLEDCGGECLTATDCKEDPGHNCEWICTQDHICEEECVECQTTDDCTEDPGLGCEWVCSEQNECEKMCECNSSDDCPPDRTELCFGDIPMDECCGYGCVGECIEFCNNCQEEACWPEGRCFEGKCESGPPACGQPPDAACQFDMNQEDCEANSGLWECSPVIEPPACSCKCPAGDAGCPCWNSNHCQGACIGIQLPWDTVEFHELVEACAKTSVGRCSDRIEILPFYCNCVFFEDQFQVMCVD
jgi:hypothetical protein